MPFDPEYMVISQDGGEVLESGIETLTDAITTMRDLFDDSEDESLIVVSKVASLSVVQEVKVNTKGE